MTPTGEADQARRPAWGWEDVALLIGAVLPSLLVGMLLMRLLRRMVPGPFSVLAVSTLTYQLLVYALLVGALFLLVSWKYGQPFWPALGWRLAFRGAIPSVLAGPALAVGVSALGETPTGDNRVSARGVRPYRVTDPLLWLLGQFGVIPVKRG